MRSHAFFAGLLFWVIVVLGVQHAFAGMDVAPTPVDTSQFATFSQLSASQNAAVASANAAAASTYAASTVSASISAAGTTLATATQLTMNLSIVTTAATYSGVALPPYNASGLPVQKFEVVNVGAATLNVYPATSSGAIRNLNGSTAALGLGLPATLVVGSHATFMCVSAALCYEAP